MINNQIKATLVVNTSVLMSQMKGLAAFTGANVDINA
jgi:hypothetical protein